MKIVDRYIEKTIIHSSLIVILMLIGIAVFINFVQEIDDLGTGNYGFFAVLIHVILTLPQQIYSFFPMAMLVGVSLGLGLLANHNELTVLRASGMSILQISWAVVKAAILLLVVATFIGEWAGPYTQHLAEIQKTLLTSKGQILETNHGIWIRDGNNFLYINSLLNHHDLAEINRYQFDSQYHLVTASYAKSGSFQHGQWIMQDVVESQIDAGKIVSKHIPTQNWQLSLNPQLLQISNIVPEEMTLKQLYQYIYYLKKNNLNANNERLAFWQRLLQPLATLVMVILAIPFVFGSTRNMGIGLRMVGGISLGFAFYLLNGFFGPLSMVYQWPPFISAAFPILLFIFLAYLLQKRIK